VTPLGAGRPTDETTSWQTLSSRIRLQPGPFQRARPAVHEQVASTRAINRELDVAGSERRRRLTAPDLWHPWLIVALALIGLSILFLVLTGARPSYDAYGWLVWGRQTLHWNLDTNGAPSWKPLTFLFTLPYALAGRGQQWLWMVTEVAAAFSGVVFAARIAYTLTGPREGRRHAPLAAGAIAGIGVLWIWDYWHLILIGSSDPMVVSLCLAAIDAQLSRRPRLAFVLLVLASLGRPEVWPFAFLFAVWAWFTIPSMRVMLPIGLLIIPALWFSVPALTSNSWHIAGDLALNSKHLLHGNKITGVIGRSLALFNLPVHLAALAAIAFAALRRDRAPLVLAGAAALWVAVEIVFALHGWSAVPRYLIEPAAIVAVLAGYAVGNALALTPPLPLVVRLAAVAAVVAFIVALIPAGGRRVRLTHGELTATRKSATRLDRLHAVIVRLGGPARILACGHPVTLVGNQSTLAWELGLNVGVVGYRPGREIDSGRPIVIFKPHGRGWQVRPVNTLAADRAACAALRTDTPLT
jgi:hypothetical protein